MTAILRDPFGRKVNNLRISVTQQCNLECFFCHKEGEKERAQVEMTSEEIRRIASIAASFGIKKVKLTGGEPLLRKDIVEVVSQIRDIREIRDLAMTTNGIQLEDLAASLKTAGLSRVNVSLGTVRAQTYREITGVDAVEKVRRGILEAKRVGLHPIKLNMVVLKGLNEDQIWEMVDFSKAAGFVLQLIEVESSTAEDDYYKRFHKDLSEVENELERRTRQVVVREMQGRKRFLLQNGGEVEVVKPMHNTEFCRNCTRLRVTSDGKLKPCLFRSDNLVDILSAIRSNAPDGRLRELFKSAVAERRPYFA